MVLLYAKYGYVLPNKISVNKMLNSFSQSLRIIQKPVNQFVNNEKN